MKIVVQFLSIALFLLCFNSAQAQDFMHKGLSIKHVNTNFNAQTAHKLGSKTYLKKASNPNSTQSNHEILPSDGSYYYTANPQTGGPAPNPYRRYDRANYVITAAELTTAGKIPTGSHITSLGFEYGIALTVASTGTMRVYLANTTSTTNALSATWATAIAGMTLVDSSSDVIAADEYTFIHTLSRSSNFTYTGGGLYVAWEWTGTAANTSYTVAMTCTTITSGCKWSSSTSSLPASLTSYNYRPATIMGFNVGKDAEVAGVYTEGLLPLGIGVPHYIGTTIYNDGDSTVYSIPCSLAVTGVNTFSDSFVLDSLPAGYYSQFYFKAFTPTVTGSDVVAVTIPNTDYYSTNNTMSVAHTVNNTNTMAYSDGTTSYTDALGGITGMEYSMTSKFYVNGNATLNSTRIYIYSGSGQTVSAIAYDKNHNKIAQSATHVLVAADTLNYYTFTFPSPPTINNDSVYVGLDVASTTATSFPMGMETENWMRDEIFYLYDATDGWVDLGTSNYGDYMIEANFTPVLPVELTSFTSTVSNGKVNLSWNTATEVSNNGFQIERTLAGQVSWAAVGFVKGSGNSNSTKHYSFTDNSVTSGKYNYRLKQIDNNGRYNYSNVINAEVTVPGTFALSQNYPNPFNPSTKIDYTLPVDSRVKIELYNVAGQKVGDLVNNEQAAGFYSINVSSNSFKNLTSGVYIYKMTAIEKATGNNFVSSKKLMLMK